MQGIMSYEVITSGGGGRGAERGELITKTVTINEKLISYLSTTIILHLSILTNTHFDSMLLLACVLIIPTFLSVFFGFLRKDSVSVCVCDLKSEQ